MQQSTTKLKNLECLGPRVVQTNFLERGPAECAERVKLWICKNLSEFKPLFSTLCPASGGGGLNRLRACRRAKVFTDGLWCCVLWGVWCGLCVFVWLRGFKRGQNKSRKDDCLSFNRPILAQGVKGYPKKVSFFEFFIDFGKLVVFFVCSFGQKAC